MIKTNNNAVTLFRELDYENSIGRQSENLWKIQEVNYTLYRPTLLRTKESHCVINNSSEERIIISYGLSVSYDVAKEFLLTL